MNVWPVITRELRAQARQPFTYWLRVLGLVAMLGAAGTFVLEHGLTPGDGGQLFAFLHVTLLLSIWVLVPMSVADCLSQERREGTLGLLMLTPLRPWDIVLAKAAAHALRAFTLWFVVLPVMALVFLQGGIGWREAALSASINFSSICIAIGAGVLASSYCKQWLRALPLAVIFSGLAFAVVAGGKTWVFVLLAVSFFLKPIPFPSLDQFLSVAWVYVTDWRAMWSEFFNSGGMGAGFVRALMFSEVISGLVIVSLSLGLLWLAARNVRRRWREEPSSARAQQMENVFCQPRFGVDFLRRWMRRKLEHNPIGWLEQRHWSGRMVTWAWFAIIISVYSVILTDRNFFRGNHDMQTLMGWLLAVSMAVSAAGSFRRERETGVLELLLVSPLTTRQIIGGRLRGLWGQFFPSVVTLLGLWAYFISIFRQSNSSSNGDGMAGIWFFAVSFLVIPVIGLYFSVQCRHFISALLLTLGFAFAVPSLFSGVVTFWQWSNSWGGDPFAWRQDMIASTSFVQLFIAAYLLLRLHHKLEHRSFPLERLVG